MNPQQALVLLNEIYPIVYKKQELINRKQVLETKFNQRRLSFSNQSGTEKVMMFIIFIIFPLAFLLLLFFQVIEKIFRKRQRENHPEINEINASIVKINRALNKYDFLPQDYKTSEAVYFMIKYFENRRVDSLKEAMNLFESERFIRQNVESQQKIIKNQNRVIKNQNRAIKNQDRHERLLRRIKNNTYYR